MKVWAWVGGIAAVVWSVIWIVGALATERVIGAWLDGQSRAGWDVSYETIDTSGYPVRFATVVEGLDLGFDRRGWGWQGDVVHLEQPSYQPHFVTARLPDTHVLRTPFEELSIASPQMDVSIEVQPGANFAVKHGAIDLADILITSTLGWSGALASGRVELQRAEAEHAFLYDLSANAEGLTLATEVLAILDPQGQLSEVVDQLSATAQLEFDRVWDLDAFETVPPGLTAIHLQNASIRWGDLTLSGSGALQIDENGQPVGEIAVTSENWRQIYAIARRAGMIAPGLEGTFETGLSMIAAMSGEPENIETVLTFENGLYFLGPFPMGPAPVLTLQ